MPVSTTYLPLSASARGTPHLVAWDDLEHVALTHDFLNDPEAYLRHLAE